MGHLKPYTSDYLVRYADRETGEIFEKVEHLKFNQTVSQLQSAYEYFGWFVIEIKEIEGK